MSLENIEIKLSNLSEFEDLRQE